MKTVLLSILLTLFSNHDFYLSLTEINYSTENKSLEVSIKLFTDDLEMALKQAGATNIGIGTKNEIPEVNELIESYLQDHFELIIKGESINYTYLGKEQELDATWCYLEASNVKKVQLLEVRNSIFLEVFEAQTNMVNTFINGRKKSGLARKDNTLLKFDF